ncbi:choice-of-anchor P family protein [Pseudonocardia sp. N23]|uniref:choice-of-anchor P family protein n=1 Tax=Pseudonocardia sp. N23 TaxID=1987376 RepID=UPI000C029A47|nr:choice-of-anchor P family protein [Pseudonocardia sp. N23]GAY09552.1 LigA protein [Pseudonocardia sp. N23]
MNRTRPPASRGRRIARCVALVALVPAMAIASAGAAFADVSAVSGSAFGESVNVTVLGTGLVTSGPLPTVTLPALGSAGPVTDNAANVSVLGLLSTGVLNVSTQGVPGATGSVTSSATVANPKVGLAIAPAITADAVGSTCTSNSSGSTGSTTIANLRVLGAPVDVSAVPNTGLNVANVGILYVNEQVTTGSGASTGITVNAVRVTLNAGLGNGTIIIGQSKCAVTGDGVVVPTGAVGGVLLAGVVAAGFGVTQVRRRRRGEQA